MLVIVFSGKPVQITGLQIQRINMGFDALPRFKIAAENQARPVGRKAVVLIESSTARFIGADIVEPGLTLIDPEIRNHQGPETELRAFLKTAFLLHLAPREPLSISRKMRME